MISGRRRSVIFFTVLGICLVTVAVTLNVSWLVLNWREGVLIVFGSIFFLVIIAGVVLNTIFLVREIRRNEQHDSFINAVTHELKTPVASIRLYLQTLQSRELDEDEAPRVLPDHAGRQRSAAAHDRPGPAGRRDRLASCGAAPRVRVDLAEIARECVELARTRFHLGPDALEFVEHTPTAARWCSATRDELKAAVWNLHRQRRQVLARRRARSRVALEELPTTSGRRSRHRSRRRDFAARAEADLPPLLPHSRQRGRPHQGQRPGLFIVRSVADGTAAGRLPRVTAPGAAARSRFCCRGAAASA